MHVFYDHDHLAVIPGQPVAPTCIYAKLIIEIRIVSLYHSDDKRFLCTVKEARS
jgi:hypothetical protein